jgi:hypothetical protein
VAKWGGPQTDPFDRHFWLVRLKFSARYFKLVLPSSPLKKQVLVGHGVCPRAFFFFFLFKTKKLKMKIE